jgi:hypothetical protein
MRCANRRSDPHPLLPLEAMKRTLNRGRTNARKLAAAEATAAARSAAAPATRGPAFTEVPGWHRALSRACHIALPDILELQNSCRLKGDLVLHDRAVASTGHRVRASAG